MGDRTTVSIQVSERDWVYLANKYEGGNETKFESRVGVEENEFFEDGIVHVTQHEVNYAEWNTLEDILKEERISYDKTWGAGGDYNGGSAYYRTVDGQYRGMEIYENEEETIRTLEEVLELLKVEGYSKEQVAQVVESKIYQKRPFIPDKLNRSNSADFIKEEVGES